MLLFEVDEVSLLRLRIFFALSRVNLNFVGHWWFNMQAKTSTVFPVEKWVKDYEQNNPSTITLN